ncbi:hypothetical protein O0L34_g18027 [Tuta absoluta]|nr:hypothetical protein O0L34_g18027 [Tuta absoluta]
MIDYARPYDPNMCDIYPPAPTPARLDDFQVFKKNTSYVYGNYYTNLTYDPYTEPEIDASVNVYHNLVTSRECHRDDWKYKIVVDWNEDDTASWIIEVTQAMGFTEYDVPYYNFRIPGSELRVMKRDEVIQRLSHPSVDPALTRRIGDSVYEKLQNRLTEEMYRSNTVLRYAESDSYSQEAQTMLDLDSLDHRNKLYSMDYKPPQIGDSSMLVGACDSSDDAEDVFRSSATASPEYSCGSDASKSGDEDDKRKMFKRPPGRPKGSGKKICKRPRSVSVPEFLRNLLLDPKYCPNIIKWEDHTLGKFRFVKPDAVAKLWGELKQNENMTFEKFSRAMRYHYRQNVLVSVPTARLVYQFGSKGPDFRTDNPNFAKVKTELESYDIYS